MPVFYKNGKNWKKQTPSMGVNWPWGQMSSKNATTTPKGVLFTSTLFDGRSPSSAISSGGSWAHLAPRRLGRRLLKSWGGLKNLDHDRPQNPGRGLGVVVTFFITKNASGAQNLCSTSMGEILEALGDFLTPQVSAKLI